LARAGYVDPIDTRQGPAGFARQPEITAARPQRRVALLDAMRQGSLIALGTEFGRPAGFDGGGGRGHHSKRFSLVLAGGGLRTGQAVGTSDELGMKIVSDPISIPDYHATIHAALGTDPATELHAGERPVPLTDGGVPIARLFG